MTTDQKRIDDIKKQNDLMVEQEIIKRRMAKGYDENGNLKELDAGEMAKIRQQVTDANADIILKNQEIIDKSREFSTGWTAAFNQYKSDAENAAMAAKSMFSTMTTSFEDLMVNFVKTGSLDFKTFANNIIAEFVRIQAKQIALGIFGGSGTSSVMGSILGLPGRASGGPVTGNSPYLVGENGPELFVPKTSGQIVPNGAMGGSTQVTYNINAVDAPSFRTMLAREPELIYAITQKGANSIPSARY
jgi:lambda family phage tail tape measure protein